MKILRDISSVNPVAGGPINGLINSSRKLLFKNHIVTVVALDDPLGPWVKHLK
ncbi:hypothetical protein [Aliiglaciecola aliphaticivorans]